MDEQDQRPDFVHEKDQICRTSYLIHPEPRRSLTPGDGGALSGGAGTVEVGTPLAERATDDRLPSLSYDRVIACLRPQARMRHKLWLLAEW